MCREAATRSNRLAGTLNDSDSGKEESSVGSIENGEEAAPMDVESSSSVFVEEDEVEELNYDSSRSNVTPNWATHLIKGKRKKARVAPPPTTATSAPPTTRIIVAEPTSPLPVVDEGVVVAPAAEKVEMMSAFARIPRQWQLSNAEFEICLYDLNLWRARLDSFRALSVITKKDVAKDANLVNVLKERQKELHYLSDELYNIWGNGCTSAPSNRDADTTEKIARIRLANGHNEDGKVRSDPMAIAFCIFFQTTKSADITPYNVEAMFNKLQTEVTGIIELHKRYDYCKLAPLAFFFRVLYT